MCIRDGKNGQALLVGPPSDNEIPKKVVLAEMKVTGMTPKQMGLECDDYSCHWSQ